MQQRYEYKFVRLGEGAFWVKRSGQERYQAVVYEHAQQGWRLVQIFAPGTGWYGSAKYYELIFERGCEDARGEAEPFETRPL